MKKLMIIIMLTLCITGAGTDTVTSEEYTYSDINIEQYKSLEEELKILPKKLLQDLNEVGVTINIYDSFLEESYGKYAGAYFWDSKEILIDDAPEQIRHATIHEIGHALDGIWVFSENENIIDSYYLNEIEFGDYYYSDIKEYVAQSISEFYKGTLNEDTIIFRELYNTLKIYV